MNELVTFTDKLDNKLVLNADGVWCMSSLAIAELTGKRHDNVLADIREMFEELEINAAEFGGYYFGDNGKQLPLFNLPKRECLILVSGYSVQMRAAIVDRWQALEDAEAERQQAALAAECEARAQREAAFRHLEFQIITGKSSVRDDVLNWKRRFSPLTSAYNRKPDEYGYKHTPKQAVDVLAPYAEEAIRLISIALNARMALDTAMVKCGVDVNVVHKVVEEFITYVDRDAGR